MLPFVSLRACAGVCLCACVCWSEQPLPRFRGVSDAVITSAFGPGLAGPRPSRKARPKAMLSE